MGIGALCYERGQKGSKEHVQVIARVLAYNHMLSSFNFLDLALSLPNRESFQI